MYIEPDIGYESMKQNFHIPILVLNDIHINKVLEICKSHCLAYVSEWSRSLKRIKGQILSRQITVFVGSILHLIDILQKSSAGKN